ncbi:rifin PIR protein, putative [Plasmodium reichenowi]|uniref:Rifin PIR protein, putative n=1 Tax=Plasmodium reichenowi TaxID=5854 RepID=A0A2P9DBC6_PLARE|nr:rifin PIR protein, putative [Plasmodium reichenowi]
MKLHYTKILLFALPLNILVTSSSNAHNKNKPYITTRHTTRYTSRVLSEKDIQSSSYDNDADMKSVKENFDRQTSQRLREYDELMKVKRQKQKEERDKNIEQIIEKDKMEKSLVEKVEKGCLRCGCGLGGVAASVGLFGGLGVYGWKTSAIAAAAKAKGAEVGMRILICRLKEELVLKELYRDSLVKFITTKNYLNQALIIEHIEEQYELCFATESECGNHYMIGHYISGEKAERIKSAVQDAKRIVEEAVERASKETISVTESQMASLEADELAQITETSTYAYSAIGYSVLAILIIVLVMIIIYLVLRYRRKKKMKKKAQYAKLLNQ